MHLRIYTDFVHDTFLDGIRFRKGYYELVTDYSRLPELLYYNSNPGGRGPRRPPTYFRAYFEQHQAELARENPFVACSFMFDMSHPEEWPISDHDGYTPAKPADIPRLVLCHTPFYKMRLISMRAVPDWSQTLLQEQEQE